MAQLDFDDESDTRDACTVLYATGMATRCSGGRIVLDGYVCTHCGADNSMEPCKAPKRNAK